MTDDRPVIVVGAGPVGMACALLLARWGVPTVVLEARPAPASVGSRSICVQRDVLDIYHRIGVADELVAEGVTWHRGRTFYRDRELFTITFPETGRSAYPGFINIGQSSVEQILTVACSREPLVSMEYSNQVVALRQSDDAVTVRANAPTGTVNLTGSHLIAADGAHSSVRSLLALDFDGHSFDDLFLIADIRARLSFGAERRFHFDPEWNPGRQVLVHPQPDSVWRIDWQVPPDYDLEADRASGGLDERVRRIVGDTAYEIVWASLYRFHQRLAARMRVARVLLAGDAAHVMAPFGARGLNSGIQDAENAAWKIAFTRFGWAGSALLPSYETERRAAAEENLRVTGETMRFLVPRNETEWARRREVLELAVTDAATRTLVNSGKLAEPYWYLDSPLTTGETPADFPTGPGQLRPPVPGVLCPDGPVVLPDRPATRLRELFGGGFALLTHGVDTDVSARAPCHTYRLDKIDREGVATAALRATPGWCAVVRPDGHLAAVLHNPDRPTLAAALDRARGVPG
jgi:2-polyprenyl-6-methoxyphenol hydroxylase-like FAD-dependent oxidoreductase